MKSYQSGGSPRCRSFQSGYDETVCPGQAVQRNRLFSEYEFENKIDSILKVFQRIKEMCLII